MIMRLAQNGLNKAELVLGSLPPRNWHPPARPERPRCHLQYRRSLLSFELRDPHQAQHPPHGALVESLRDDFFRRLRLFDVQLQNLVQQLVRRQAVLVGLIGPELGRRRLGEGRFRDVRLPFIPPPRTPGTPSSSAGPQSPPGRRSCRRKACNTRPTFPICCPVVSSSDPNLFESAISRAPRIRDWMFSSVTSGWKLLECRRERLVVRPHDRRDSASILVWMPRLRASSSASATLPSLEYIDGIITPRTFSGPIASAAIAAVRAESMPPDRPSSTLRKPVLRA